MSEIQTLITNEQTILMIDDARIENVVESVLNCQQVEVAEISVVLVDNETIHQINREHLEHDFPTDVITFPLSEPYADCLEGEIVISTQMATEIAPSVPWSITSEVELYLIHGLLHLCGFDDLDPAALKLMREQEHAMLRHVGISPALQDQRWHDLSSIES